MSDRAFFDTNILVYTLGQRDDRTPKADALLASGGVVSVQVLNELASVAHRKLRMSWPDVTAALADIKILCPSPIPITVETHDAALRLAVRHGYHVHDAPLAATDGHPGRCVKMKPFRFHNGGPCRQSGAHPHRHDRQAGGFT